jgi:hypothetical protein
MGTFFSGVHVFDFSRVDNVIFRPLLHLIVNILEIMGVSKWSNDPGALEKKKKKKKLFGGPI